MSLVINRKVGERIFIGDNIEIRIVDRQNGQVALAIHAPGISVKRGTKDEDAQDRADFWAHVHAKREHGRRH